MRAGRRRSTRLAVVSFLVIFVGVLACTQAARYRVLRFFFDGVPRPGATWIPARSRLGVSARTGAEGTSSERAAPRRSISFHPPAANDQCDSCHDAFSGRLVKTPEDGLCATCHAAPPGDDAFVHGPVAARACLRCHDPHSSIYVKLLTADEPDLCFGCHEETALSAVPEHAADSARACTTCHDPHGGANRFFLRRSEP